MDTNISYSPDQTEALGEAWGRSARSGLVIGLIGELGAGKTQLVRGLARGLGCSERVHSPTFALLHEYTSGRFPLFHLDLYRLDTPAAIQAAGLEEYLCQPKGISVVEWIEHWLPLPDSINDPRLGTAAPSDPASGSARHLRSNPTIEAMAAASSAAVAQEAVAAAVPAGFYRLVWIEVLSQNQRRICHEDFGR